MSTDKLYVVIKRGLFWRPEDKGYTAKIEEAGRYTKEEAESRCHGGEQPVTMALASSFQTQESLQAEVDALRLALAAEQTKFQEYSAEMVAIVRASKDEAEKAKAELRAVNDATDNPNEPVELVQKVRNMTAECESLRADKERLERIEDMPPFTYTGNIHDIRMAMDVHIANYVRPTDAAIDAALNAGEGGSK